MVVHRRARADLRKGPLYHDSIREQLLELARLPPVGGHLFRFFHSVRNYTYIRGGSQGGFCTFRQKSFRAAPPSWRNRPVPGIYRLQPNRATYSGFWNLCGGIAPARLKYLIASSPRRVRLIHPLTAICSLRYRLAALNAERAEARWHGECLWSLLRTSQMQNGILSSNDCRDSREQFNRCHNKCGNRRQCLRDSDIFVFCAAGIR